MIKLIIFDLWNTLAAISGPSTTEGIMKILDLDIKKEKCRKIYEQSYQTKKYNSLYDACRQLCIDFKIEPKNELVKNLSTMFKKNIVSIDLFPHTIKMLEQLKKQRYYIGLISNTSNCVIKKIKKTELFDYIDYPLFSFDIGLIKPNYKIFIEMLTRAKCKPNEAMMIGDSLIDDIIPSKRLGMNAIQFKNYEQLKKELAPFGIYIA